MNSSQTVAIFGVYIFVSALLLLFAPGLIFALFFAPAPSSPSSVLLGVIALAVGYYYMRLGRAGSAAFVQATVVGRLGVFLGVVLAVIVGALPAGFLIFGAVELLGALWTGRVLKREGLAAINF